MHQLYRKKTLYTENIRTSAMQHFKKSFRDKKQFEINFEHVMQIQRMKKSKLSENNYSKSNQGLKIFFIF